jgi:hypothetical protein
MNSCMKRGAPDARRHICVLDTRPGCNTNIRSNVDTVSGHFAERTFIVTCPRIVPTGALCYRGTGHGDSGHETFAGYMDRRLPTRARTARPVDWCAVYVIQMARSITWGSDADSYSSLSRSTGCSSVSGPSVTSLAVAARSGATVAQTTGCSSLGGPDRADRFSVVGGP